MGGAAPIPDAIKRTICSDIAMRLGARHGRRAAYEPAQVAIAMRESRLPPAADAWAMAVYCSPAAFERFAAGSGLAPDYAAMRGDIIRFVPAPNNGDATVWTKSEGPKNSMVDMIETAADLGEVAVDLVTFIFDCLDGL
jgi:predicted trehalose synthase